MRSIDIDEQKFWNNTTKGVHWLYTRNVKRGVGTFMTISSRRRMTARQVSYLLHYGPYPKTMDVAVNCGVNLCIHPEHLYLEYI